MALVIATLLLYNVEG